MQSSFNAQAIAMLPKIEKAISHAKTFEANQMYCVTIKACVDSSISISDMSSAALLKFEKELLDHFTSREWL